MEVKWYEAPLAFYPSGALFRPIPFNPTSTIKHLRNHFTAPSTREHIIAQGTFRASLAGWTPLKIAPRNQIPHHYPVGFRPAEPKGPKQFVLGAPLLDWRFLPMTGPIAPLDGGAVGAWLSLS